MRIAIITPAYVPAFSFGGPVTQLRQIAKSLHKRGHTVTIYTTNATSPSTFATLPSKEYIDGILVKRYPVLFHIAGYWFTPFMLNALLRDEFDVIHTNCARSFQSDLGSLISRIKNVPLIIQSRGSIGSYTVKGSVNATVGFLYPFHNFILKVSLNQAKRVIALTSSEVSEYQSMGVSKNKIAIIPNGVDLSEFSFLPQKGKFREKYRISSDKKIILFLGRINQIKGIDVLINAFSILKKDMPSIKLVIAGPPTNYLRFCNDLVAKYNLITDVLFTGSLYGESKLEAYVDADIFVLPSRYEGFPNVLLEAFACSKPVVSSDIKSISDIVSNGKTGLLFESCNSEELAKQMSFLLLNSEHSNIIAENSNKMVKEKFSTDVVTCLIEMLYKEVILTK